ncbi:hypothetical protein P9209_18315 [Prescottella defluvii]|nr:hypothetical protein P9209_18315 [Prescottella defluvii]
MRAVQEGQPLLAAQGDRLEPVIRQCCTRGDEFTVDIDTTLTEEGHRHVRLRSEVTDRTFAGHMGRDPVVEEIANQSEDLQARSRVPLPQALEHHQLGRPDHFLGERFADRDGVREHDVALQLLGVLRRDDLRNVVAESCCDPVDQAVLRQKPLDQLA